MTRRGSEPYDDRFYGSHATRSLASADTILPIVLDAFSIRFPSIIDVGCGRGSWLQAATTLGATRQVGLDGEWNTSWFRDVPQVDFRPVNLGDVADVSRSLAGDEHFDLAICVEVVEHVSPAAGAEIIRGLARTADVVLFSAAIPGQGGTNHINEQWPSHWAAHFASHGLAAYDVVRPRIWADSQVEVWYRQNIVVYARRERAHGMVESSLPALDLVHPEHHAHRQENPMFRDWMRATTRIPGRAIARFRK